MPLNNLTFDFGKIVNKELIEDASYKCSNAFKVNNKFDLYFIFVPNQNLSAFNCDLILYTIYNNKYINTVSIKFTGSFQSNKLYIIKKSFNYLAGYTCYLQYLSTYFKTFYVNYNTHDLLEKYIFNLYNNDIDMIYKKLFANSYDEINLDDLNIEANSYIYMKMEMVI